MGDFSIPVATAVLTAILSGAVTLGLQFLVLPKLERNKTIEQELWRTKKDTFLAAMGLVDRMLACAPWHGDVPADYTPNVEHIPDSNELNEQFHRLLLVVDDMKIPNMFRTFMSGVTTAADRGTFLLLLRRELFRSKVRLDPNTVPFFFPRTKEQLLSAMEAYSHITPLLDKLEARGARVLRMEVNRPQLGETSLEILCPSEEIEAECKELLASHERPGSLHCEFRRPKSSPAAH